MRRLNSFKVRLENFYAIYSGIFRTDLVQHRVLCQTFTATCHDSTIVAGSSKGLTNYPMLYIQFWAPDDGWRNRPKYVEHFTGINKLCNAASCWLYLKIQNYPWKRIIKKGELLSLITIGKYIWFDALEANKVENILFLKWLRVHWSLWYQHSRGSCGLELWGTEIYPEEVSHKFARNLCTFLPNYMKSHPRRLVFSG